MTYLDKWCEGKSPILAMFVQAFVPEFDETHQTLSQIRIGNPMVLEVPVPAKLWRKFYWRNNRVMRHVSGLLTGSTNLDEVRQLLSGVSEDELVTEIHNEYGETPNFQELIGQWMLDLVRSDKPIEQSAAYGILAVTTFAWRIWMPCWLHYGRTPLDLLYAAKNGDNQAMDQLLRIDKSAVTIPCVGRRWHEIMTGGNAGLRRFMFKAITGQPGRMFQPTKVKMTVCALIQLIGEKLDSPLSTDDMRLLLDAIEKDRTGKEYAIDTLIPDDENSLARGLLREREHWMSFLPAKKYEAAPTS